VFSKGSWMMREIDAMSNGAEPSLARRGSARRLLSSPKSRLPASLRPTILFSFLISQTVVTDFIVILADSFVCDISRVVVATNSDADESFS